MGSYEFKAKNGLDYHIWDRDLDYIDAHADELDRSIYEFFFNLVDTVKQGEIRAEPVMIFYFLQKELDDPILNTVNDIEDEKKRVSAKTLAKYIAKEDLDDILRYTTSRLTFNQFQDGFCERMKNTNGEEFPSKYDSLIILSKATKVDLQAVLIWYYLFIAMRVPYRDIMESIQQHVLADKDNTKLFG